MLSKAIPIVLALVFAPHLAVAQEPSASQPTSKSRAQVKAETLAAEKSGQQLTPKGETEVSPPAASRSRSAKTRAERKEETKQARKAGQLAPAGEGADKRADDATRAQGTTKSRAERKAETRAAEKAHALTPAGEAPTAPKN